MDSRRDEDAVLGTALRQIASQAGEVEHATHPPDAVFASYLSGTLAGDERERFEVHVAGCARCADDLGGTAVVESLGEWRMDGRATPGATADTPGTEGRPGPSVVRRGSGRNGPRLARSHRAGRFLRKLSLAAAAVLFVGIGLRAGGDALLGRLAPEASVRLTEALARPAHVGALSLGFASGPALRVQDLEIGDDPRFSSGALFRVATADLAVDAGALLRGRLQGSVRLDQPTLQLVRDARGEWNVETLGREGEREAGRATSGTAARQAPDVTDPAVRLGSARVSAGTLAITDRAGGAERALVVEDVDVDYRSSGEKEPASITLAGEIQGRALLLRGEIGPFGGAPAPRYRFAEVSFAGVDLASVPGAPASVSGELSFSGRIEGVGRSLDAVVATATGAGALELSRGTLGRRNLDRELVNALAAAAPAGLTGAVAAVAPRLAVADTDYRYLGGRVEVGATGLRLQAVELETSLFSAATEGSLSRAGDVDVRGDVTLGSELTQALVAVAPGLGAAAREENGIVLPFSLVGRWPEARLEVDVAATLRTAAAALDPRRFALARWLTVGAAG